MELCGICAGVEAVMKSGVAGSLMFLMLGAQAQQRAEPANSVPNNSTEVAQQQAIPDAPKPQSTLPDLGNVTPGKGSTGTPVLTTPTTGNSGSSDDQSAPPSASTRQNPSANAEKDDQPAADVPAPGQGPHDIATLSVTVNFVEVPFTVKDSKGRLVPGLTPRDVRVYENGQRYYPRIFTVDPWPLSVAMLIDQTMTTDEMTTVNNALGAVTGAFAPYDAIAVFTYNNGPKMVTDFTGAQSARLTAALEKAKGPGRPPLMAGSLDGPMAHTTNINGQEVDPNTQANRGHLPGMELNPPKDFHTLNDAILEAAKSLTKVPPGRRRIIYVISDGKEYGSTAKFKDVVKYLQTNNIQVYGTLVGDSAMWGIGFLDRIHLPLTMRDNILPAYAAETAGNFSADFRQKQIESSFAKIAEEARVQYTLGYYTKEPFIDGKYRKLDVYVMRPNLQVFAKKGYWPGATEMRPKTVSVQ
jgi:VWFA-related protein